ncbi:hypothetical protein B9N43_16895 [Denitratisoma sp. DHT3]|nr:hypothetical protein B9N43_16895 [Denitratisoma sp. DHT3]
MYLKHFELARPPFQITPDTDFFFSGSRRGGILSALQHVACHEEGIVIVVAEIGSGKTLLARLLIAHLADNVDSVYLANPRFSRDEIITAISRDLGLTDLSSSTEGSLARLHEELLRRHAQGRRVMLVVDEAHAMPPESLEEVRMLSNLETDRHKLVNIVLFGQPELDTLLADRKLRQVRDRVIHRFELPPLTSEEAEAYIDHRLRIAGWRGGRLFSPAAMALVIKASQGRARRINLLADKSLLAAYAKTAQRVDKSHVRTAFGDLDANPAQTRTAASRRGWRLGVSSFALGAFLSAAVAWWLAHPAASASPAPQTAAAVQDGMGTSSRAVSRKVSPVVSPVIAEPDPDMIITRTEAAVADPQQRGFTLQLATLPARVDLTKYLNKIKPHVDLSNVYAHRRNYADRAAVAIYLGSYPDEQAAREALSALPPQLRADHPVLRTWAGIRAEQHP